MKSKKEKVTEGHLSASNDKQKSSRGEKCLAKFTSSNGSVFGSLTLDIRKAGDYSQPLPVVVRIAHEGKKAFLRLGEKYTMEEWIQLCDYEKTGRRIQLAERNDLKALMEKIKDMTNQLVDEGRFSIKRLQDLYQGREDGDSSIYKIWEEYRQNKKDEDSVGSARVGRDVMNRFIKDNGDKVAFSDIDHDFVMKWRKKLEDEEKSSSYIGLLMRTFRTIVNIAIDRGLIKGNTKEMFKNTGYNLMESRKGYFVGPAVWKQLYEFWEKGEAKDENGKELFIPKEKDAIFRDLGLLLFMYLGNGQNLADTLRLEYDDWYFATEGKQMRFHRHKTKGRNKNGSEVIFPVTHEIQEILDRHANKPKLGQRVFPIMSKFITAEQEMWVVQRYNKYIRNHMKKVTKLLDIKAPLTPTWARHSFATNLTSTGNVPDRYIQGGMGHSDSGDITSKYIGPYPLKKMLEYNSYLLKVIDDEEENKEENATEQKDKLLEMLKNMTEEERAALMEEASK